MQKLSLFILLFISIQIRIIAQNYTFISKDLHKMEDAELSKYKVTFSESTPMFDENGNTISSNQINDLIQSGNFIPVVFGDTNHTAKAIVFRKTTNEEKKAIQQMLTKQDPNANYKLGRIAPDFNTIDTNGNAIHLSDLKDKIVVLNFWFTTCKPCINEIPALNKIAQKYKNKNVIFLAITFDNKEKIANFLSENTFNYTIISDIDILKSYDINNYPTSIIIDKKGKIIFKKTGTFTKLLDMTINAVLNE